MSHARMFKFWGGVAELVIPDNEKSAVRKASRYEPDLNPTCQEQLATHYGTTVLPARPRSPQDKAKVEPAVQHVERWIMAPLRNQMFFSLGELRVGHRAAAGRTLNERPFQKTEGSRRSWFEDLDGPALKPLPARRYEYAEWRKARVNIDYHIQVEHALYRIPYPLARREVNVRLSATTVEVFHKHRRVAAHLWIRGKRRIRDRTRAHAGRSPHHAEWTPSRLITLLASQVPVERWHDVVGDPTFGDAILDRLPNNAHRITLKGASMRRLYDSTKAVHTAPGDA